MAPLGTALIVDDEFSPPAFLGKMLKAKFTGNRVENSRIGGRPGGFMSRLKYLFQKEKLRILIEFENLQNQVRKNRRTQRPA